MTSRTVTLFVHGTLPPSPVLKIPLVNTFFYCPKGLTKLQDFNPRYHVYQAITTLCESAPDYFDIDHFYIFGWSGFLRFAERKKAALELYNHLRLLKRTYEAQEIVPIFKIITHSHGGNVALSLVPLAEEDGSSTMKIAELILLACPVQVETESYVNDSLFEHVYSVHSHHDILQILDPQGIHIALESLKYYGLEFTMKHLKRLGPLFSERHFIAAPHVIQLNVRYPNRELFHIEFLFPTIIRRVPELIEKMKGHERTSPSKKDDITHIFEN